MAHKNMVTNKAQDVMNEHMAGMYITELTGRLQITEKQLAEILSVDVLLLRASKNLPALYSFVSKCVNIGIPDRLLLNIITSIGLVGD